MRRAEPGAEAGQAQIELLATLPLLATVALVGLQLLFVGQAQSLADGAAEAGAIALAAGRPATAAARAALPDRSRSRLRIEVARDRVEVALRPRSLLPGLGSRLEVRSSAWARSPAGSR